MIHAASQLPPHGVPFCTAFRSARRSVPHVVPFRTAFRSAQRSVPNEKRFSSLCGARYAKIFSSLCGARYAEIFSSPILATRVPLARVPTDVGYLLAAGDAWLSFVRCLAFGRGHRENKTTSRETGETAIITAFSLVSFVSFLCGHGRVR